MRGNVLKMDRHKYVKVAHHGLRPMDADERKALYDRSRPSFNPPDYANIDTAFVLVDVCLYCQLVDLKDSRAEPSLEARSYAQIYADVRRAVDLCHCDGVIKDAVMAAPAGYIDSDPLMAGMLERIRRAGQRPFLVTNSAWEYTDAVMGYLLGAEATAFGHADWTGFFDVIVVSARKPAFMLDPNLPIFRVQPADGSLRNLEAAEFASAQSVARVLRGGKIFQGGCWQVCARAGMGVGAGVC
jgi:HAD superfamily 5'-nucleotidase-like hydrolase